MRTHWPASQFSTRDKLVGAENKQGNDTEIKQTIYFKTKQTININKPAPLAYGCGVVWHESVVQPRHRGRVIRQTVRVERLDAYYSKNDKIHSGQAV